MRRQLLDLSRNDKIGIYKFGSDGFSVGNIVSISEDYLILKSLNAMGDENGIKIFFIDKIQRIIQDSDYIKDLEGKQHYNYKYDWVADIGNLLSSLKKIYDIIVENKIKVLLQLKDDSEEIGYIYKMENSNCYFDICDSNDNIVSRDIFHESYIRCIKFFSSRGKEVGNLKKIKLTSGEIYIGETVLRKKNFIILEEYLEFKEDRYMSVIKKEDIEEISEIINAEKLESVETKKYLKDILNMKISKILEICKRDRLIIFIDNENYRETKVGIVVDLKKETFKLKILDEVNRFTEIIELKYSDIHILDIKNYRVV